MKIRTDFVTNSSSSSFILCFARVKNREELLAEMKKQYGLKGYEALKKYILSKSEFVSTYKKALKNNTYEMELLSDNRDDFDVSILDNITTLTDDEYIFMLKIISDEVLVTINDANLMYEFMQSRPNNVVDSFCENIYYDD